MYFLVFLNQITTDSWLLVMLKLNKETDLIVHEKKPRPHHRSTQLWRMTHLQNYMHQSVFVDHTYLIQVCDERCTFSDQHEDKFQVTNLPWPVFFFEWKAMKLKKNVTWGADPLKKKATSKLSGDHVGWYTQKVTNKNASIKTAVTVSVIICRSAWWTCFSPQCVMSMWRPALLVVFHQTRVSMQNTHGSLRHDLDPFPRSKESEVTTGCSGEDTKDYPIARGM